MLIMLFLHEIYDSRELSGSYQHEDVYETSLISDSGRTYLSISPFVITIYVIPWEATTVVRLHDTSHNLSNNLSNPRAYLFPDSPPLFLSYP